MRGLLAGLGLLVLALVPRLAGLEQSITADDEDWVRRAVRFTIALQRGAFAETYQTDHPGVTLFWLAGLINGPGRAAELLRTDLNTPLYLEALFDSRRALAVTSAVLTVVTMLLTWRLLGAGTGLLVGLLLACEPFLVAHGQLFHADPLLGQLMACSLLAAMSFFDRRGGWLFLVGSGVATGLAVLTKAPAVFLVAFVPLLGLSWSQGVGARAPGGAMPMSRLGVGLVLWGLVAAVTFTLLWPAMWVDPLGTTLRMAQEVRATVGSERPNGNFFLGEATDGDVGLLFYPVATLLRLSPITMLGLTLLVFGWHRARAARRGGSKVRWRRYALALVAYVGLFTLLMSISPKKIDRYLLPVFTILVVLAAIGLRLALRALLRKRSEAVRRWASLAVVLVVALGQAGQVALVQPYPLSYYNPLLGGIGTARQAVVVGWGEGLDQVADYLDRQPDAANAVVSTLYWNMIQPRFRGKVVQLGFWRQADYFVDYVNMAQRGLTPSAMREIMRTEPPLFTARINGLDYARVYRVPPAQRR
jgi:4-amino-4-deoxy-L-arabinose transferase-like glycosyltransferase